MDRFSLALCSASAIAVLTACGPRVPSSDQGEEASMPDDLPCGGADLMTDNANCGTCGNECSVLFEGTQWEAGGCIDGVCAEHPRSA